MKKLEVKQIFQRFAQCNPHPKTELNYTSPFTLLVAVVLSAQATDVGVNKATESLFKSADTPQKLLDLGEEQLISYIKTIGLHKAKAKNLRALAKILIEKHGGHVPNTREELEALPGVGRKTASVILNTVFNKPVIAVDTHIFRTSRRIGLSKGDKPLAVEKELLEIIPEEYLLYAHHWLVLHGRYICKARKPLCYQCMINDLCKYPYKTEKTP